MKAISIDPARRIARLEPGLTWGEVAGEAQRYGLALTAGDTALSLTSPYVGYLAHLFLKEAVVTLVLQAILNLSY